MKALILAICMLVVPTLAQANTHDDLECFANLHQLRLVHKYDGTERTRARHHETQSGTCWHIGPKNRSGVWYGSRPSPSKAGIGISPSHPITKITNKEFDIERAKTMWPQPGETHVPTYELWPETIFHKWWEPDHRRPLW